MNITNKTGNQYLTLWGLLVLFLFFFPACAEESHSHTAPDSTPPTINQQTFSVTEGVAVNSVVGIVEAEDNIRVTEFAITAGNIAMRTLPLANNGILLTAEGDQLLKPGQITT